MLLPCSAKWYFGSGEDKEDCRTDKDQQGDTVNGTITYIDCSCLSCKSAMKPRIDSSLLVNNGRMV